MSAGLPFLYPEYGKSSSGGRIGEKYTSRDIVFSEISVNLY